MALKDKHNKETHRKLTFQQSTGSTTQTAKKHVPTSSTLQLLAAAEAGCAVPGNVKCNKAWNAHSYSRDNYHTTHWNGSSQACDSYPGACLHNKPFQVPADPTNCNTFLIGYHKACRCCNSQNHRATHSGITTLHRKSAYCGAADGCLSETSSAVSLAGSHVKKGG